MVQEVEVNGRLRQVNVHRVDGRFVVTVDRKVWVVDAVHVDRHTLSLLIESPPELKLGPTVSGFVSVGPTFRSGETGSPVGPTFRSNELGRSPELKLGPTVSRSVGPTFRSGETSRIASYEVTIAPDRASGGLIARVGETPLTVSINGRRRRERTVEAVHTGTGPERIIAPMPGKIVRVLVKQGGAVQARQPVVVIEAMKMENELRAAVHGTMVEIHVREGQSVEAGALLAVIGRSGPVDPAK